jgi:hypothetical protein
MNSLRIHDQTGSRRKIPPALLLLLIAALALSMGVACGSSGSPATRSAAKPPKPSVESRQYGHIASLTQTGNGFELRFDPARWLTGADAERAAVAAGAIQPGEAVPNDYFIVDETHSLRTFAVPASARVTVLTSDGDPQKLGATPITVSELMQLLAGKNPKHRQLTEPKAGFWIRIGSGSQGSVLSLDQQYQP